MPRRDAALIRNDKGIWNSLEKVQHGASQRRGGCRSAPCLMQWAVSGALLVEHKINSCRWMLGMQVQHGGIAAAGRLPKRALLLCYPPPGDSMAADALRKYKCGIQPL